MKLKIESYIVEGVHFRRSLPPALKPSRTLRFPPPSIHFSSSFTFSLQSRRGRGWSLIEASDVFPPLPPYPLGVPPTPGLSPVFCPAPIKLQRGKMDEVPGVTHFTEMTFSKTLFPPSSPDPSSVLAFACVSARWNACRRGTLYPVCSEKFCYTFFLLLSPTWGALFCHTPFPLIAFPFTAAFLSDAQRFDSVV